MKRHSDAIFIQGGACNPTAITNSILAACHEIRDNGDGSTADITTDPAVRLMVHQLAFICNVPGLDNSPIEYSKALDDCEQG